MPPTKTRCCRSTPRCRTCPLRFANELRAVAALGKPAAGLPAHLDGVPPCLHKYEPLFRRAATPASPATPATAAAPEATEAPEPLALPLA